MTLHPNLKQLSNSSLSVKGYCKRAYELDKSMPRDAEEDDKNVDFKFGTTVGIGVQTLFATDDMHAAYKDMLVSWPGTIMDDSPVTMKKQKSFWHALTAVDKFVEVRKSRFSNYEVAIFDGKPAAELGFSIDCGDGFFYRGFVDLLLLNTQRQELEVNENKTTGMWQVHEAMYKHSGQGLGYSVIADHISKEMGLKVGSSWNVNYPVYECKQHKWEILSFVKNRTSRALWIKNLLLDIQDIKERGEEDYFPMNSNGCFRFGKPCQHFGYCEFSNNVIIPAGIVDRLEAEEKYQFHFKLEDIIESMLSADEVI